jgi:sugar lactone lactonase YvrE
MKRNLSILFAAFVLLLAALMPAAVDARTTTVFPAIVPLPDGFNPEGIVTGTGTDLYAGSLATGAIYRANLRTGEGEVVVTPAAGSVSAGLAFDARSGFVFAAGGPTGMASVYDPDSGETVATYELATGDTFINDVVVTTSAAYFTDSSQPAFYRLPLGPGGSLPDPADVETIALGGEFVFEPGEFNANGIEATADGEWLIIVHTFRGELYRVDPASGEATLIDLGGEAVPNGDGILLAGQTLYVVQNFLNQVAVVILDDALGAGEITDTLTDPALRIPTTVARFGSRLYVVNARFDVPPAPDVEYEVVQLRPNQMGLAPEAAGAKLSSAAEAAD